MYHEVNDIRAPLRECCLRGQILSCKKHLVERKGAEIGPAHLLGHQQLDERIDIRAQQSSAPGAGYVGIALKVNSLWALVSLPGALIVIRYGVINREERYLEQKFGEQYLSYKAKVRRWI